MEAMAMVYILTVHPREGMAGKSFVRPAGAAGAMFSRIERIHVLSNPYGMIRRNQEEWYRDGFRPVVSSLNTGEDGWPF